MSKRLFALLLALVLCVGLLAACGGNGDETTAGTTAGGDDTTAAVDTTPNFGGSKITVHAANNTDYDPEGSYVNELVEDHLNLDLEVIEYQGTDIDQMLMKGQAPELLYQNGFTSAVFSQVIDGAYINIFDYLDKMPNVKAWLEKPENAAHVAKFTSGNGKILAAIPIVQVGGNAAKYTFLYRKDIFEKNNLTFPTNQEEFVATLRKLKEVYPNSHPFVMRQLSGQYAGAQNFGYLWGGTQMIGSTFGTWFTLGEDGKYYFGAVSNAYKEMAQFFLDLEKEGLFHPSSFGMNTTAWEGAFASDTSFITHDKVDRLPNLNKAGQALNPDFLMTAGAPFNFGTHAQTATKVATDVEGAATGYCWMIGSTSKNLDNVLKYVDWLYSDEAYVMTNWGKEGESYVVNSDGTKAFKEGFLESKGGLVKSGLWSPLQSGRTDFDAYIASCDENMAASLEVIGKYYGGGPKQEYITYIGSEQDTYDTYGRPMWVYALSEFAKFATGQRDISEWDQVLATLKAEYHYDDVLKIAEDALARAQK